MRLFGASRSLDSRTRAEVIDSLSRGTGSAAEAFSSTLKSLKRATLIGDRTAGAGHMVALVDLPAGFTAGVSITRVSDARTGREWEAVGVEPDVRVAPERALATAHRLALEAQLARATDDATRRALAMRIEWVAARDGDVRGACRRDDLDLSAGGSKPVTAPAGIECPAAHARASGSLRWSPNIVRGTWTPLQPTNAAPSWYKRAIFRDECVCKRLDSTNLNAMSDVAFGV